LELPLANTSDNLDPSFHPGLNIFSDLSDHDFRQAALEIFRHQYACNEVYRRFTDTLGTDPAKVCGFEEIPFLPIGFFKTHRLVCGKGEPGKTFESSGTTGSIRSRHVVSDLSVYRESLLAGFRAFYGEPSDYEFLALMPSPAENPASSLIFMISELIRINRQDSNVFFLSRNSDLADCLLKPVATGKTRMVIGLTYAILDFAEQFPVSLPGVIIMETGGMKGRRVEMVREELHAVLKEKFQTGFIHSEYGMTELLSQAYSKGDGLFTSPPWMKVLIRDTNDPLTLLPNGKTGAINIIDLANYNSCSFIATEDLGIGLKDRTFEVLGRFDNSDIRGCSLMMV